MAARRCSPPARRGRKRRPRSSAPGWPSCSRRSPRCRSCSNSQRPVRRPDAHRRRRVRTRPSRRSRRCPNRSSPTGRRRSRTDIPAELRGKVHEPDPQLLGGPTAIAKRACREGKQFAEAEKHCSWRSSAPRRSRAGATGRLYFRRELAAVYEDRGASTTDVRRPPTPSGARRCKMWTTLFEHPADAALETPAAREDAGPTATDDASRRGRQEQLRWRSTAQERVRRRVLRRAAVPGEGEPATAQGPDAGEAPEDVDDVAKQCADMEKQIPAAGLGAGGAAPVRRSAQGDARAVAAYKAAGGKFFLEKMPL